MRVLIFDLRGSIAHFRRPDTTATFATYPIITRTAMRGLLGAVLGLDEFTVEDAWTGIRLMRPVRTRAQELSLLGKGFFGNGPAFNRPTAVELVTNPHYRIYYTGEYVEDLSRRIKERLSVYPTYLGAAFAQCVPEWIAEAEADELTIGSDKAVGADSPISTPTAVPATAIEELPVTPGVQYARMNGMLYRSLGGRRFQGTLDLIYEANGRPILFRPKAAPQPPTRLLRLASGEDICLW